MKLAWKLGTSAVAVLVLSSAVLVALQHQRSKIIDATTTAEGKSVSISKNDFTNELSHALDGVEIKTKQHASDALLVWQKKAQTRLDEKFMPGVLGYAQAKTIDAKWFWHRFNFGKAEADKRFEKVLSETLTAALGDAADKEFESAITDISSSYENNLVEAVKGVQQKYNKQGINVEKITNAALAKITPETRPNLAYIPGAISSSMIAGIGAKAAINALTKRSVSQTSIRAMSMGLQLCNNPATMARCQVVANQGRGIAVRVLQTVGLKPLTLAGYATPIAATVAISFMIYQEQQDYSSKREKFLSQYKQALTDHRDQMLSRDGIVGSTIQQANKKVLIALIEQSPPSLWDHMIRL